MESIKQEGEILNNFTAFPIAIIIYFAGLKISYELLIKIFDKPQEWQILIVTLMGLFSAIAVTLIVEVKYDFQVFKKMSLLMLGMVFGVAALFSYARNLGVAEIGFEYDISFAILAATALFFGKR